MKLLVIEQEVFIDPHGSHDDVKASNKFVSEKEHFLKMDGKCSSYQITDSDFIYCEKNSIDIKEFLKDLDEDELNASEDGYNSNYFYYSVRKITDEEYNSFVKIINDYNNIK